MPFQSNRLLPWKKWLDTQVPYIWWATCTRGWNSLARSKMLSLEHLFSFWSWSNPSKSFKNLAYDGTCWIASKNGMFIWTCLNTSKISANCAFFFVAFNLSGYGAFGINDLEGSSTVGMALGGSTFPLLSLPLSFPYGTIRSSSSWTTLLSTCLPDLSVAMGLHLFMPVCRIWRIFNCIRLGIGHGLTW